VGESTSTTTFAYAVLAYKKNLTTNQLVSHKCIVSQMISIK